MSDRPVRLIRVMEYIYPNAAAMAHDQRNWHVPANGEKSHREGYLIKSAILPVDYDFSPLEEADVNMNEQEDQDAQT